MSRTSWRIETEQIGPQGIGAITRLRLTLDTDDPEIVALVEASARNAGVELVRELARADVHDQLDLHTEQEWRDLEERERNP